MEDKNKKNITLDLIIIFILGILLIGYLASESQPSINVIFQQLISIFILLLFIYAIFKNEKN